MDPTKPYFQQPTNKQSALVAIGWIEQYRKSKMRYVWKEVLASLVQGQKPGEETTLWIQREFVNATTMQNELEPLHQIPLKMVENITLKEDTTDNQFALRIYNSTDEFVFRCADSPVDSLRWVQILKKFLAASKGKPSTKFDEKKEAPPAPPDLLDQHHHQTHTAGSVSSNSSNMTIRELRAICHGAGINTAGMERTQLEEAADEVRRRGTFFSHNGSTQQHSFPFPTPAASSAPPYFSQPHSTGTSLSASIHELRAICHGAGINTAGMERKELEAAAENVKRRGTFFDAPPPGMHAPSSDAWRHEEKRRQQDQQAAMERQKQQEDIQRKAAAAAAAEEQRKRSEQARRKAEEEARLQVMEQEKQRKLEQEARQRALAAEQERQRKLEEEARIRAIMAEQERRRKLEEETRRRAMLAEQERQRKLEEDARIRALAAEQERQRKLEEEARRRALAVEQERQRRLAEEAMKRAAEEESRRRAAAAAAEQLRWQRAEEERQKAAAEQHRRHQEQQAAWQRQQEEEKKRRQADQWAQIPSTHAHQQSSWNSSRQNSNNRQQHHWNPPQAQQRASSQHHPRAPPPQQQQYSSRQQHPKAPPPQQQHQQSSSPASKKYAAMANGTNGDDQATMTKLKHGILLQWALQPPQMQILRSIDVLITTIHSIFPPALGVPGHPYFQKWKPLQRNDIVGASGLPDDEKLKKSVRKIRFFLHPDKLPNDLTEEQKFMTKMLWDITSDAWEEHEKKKEDLGWVRN
ncbi:hypothetical protein IV203_003869 [Nitzschia inconspicua]|uniref:PH domain-containing protein n=1 Tax=Nitzschia inconspicua TaxID=303405 RepID=A0A9K3L445_9STRA|nr:hypothetical protein IV203_003869 [Nitzschia inconspicua]